jgi:hypothetical protein
MYNIIDINLYRRYQFVIFIFDKSLIFLMCVRCAIYTLCPFCNSEHTSLVLSSHFDVTFISKKVFQNVRFVCMLDFGMSVPYASVYT